MGGPYPADGKGRLGLLWSVGAGTARKRARTPAVVDTAAGIGLRRTGMGSEPRKANSGHANFVHLRVKSPYSLLEGAVRPDELASLARDMRMPAVAVTDTNNLFGVYEIADTLAKAGVQPIVGVTLSMDLDAPATSQNHN